MEDFVISLIVLPSIVSTVVAGVLLRRFDKYQKTADMRAQVRAEENYLILRSITGLSDLAKATATAVKTGDVNGPLTAALNAQTEKDTELRNFMMRQTAEQSVRK